MQPNHSTNKQPTITRFALGRTFITPRAEEALQIAGQTAIEFLRRHMSGDWGELSDEDVKENEFSLKEGSEAFKRLPDRKGAEDLDHHRRRSQRNDDPAPV